MEATIPEAFSRTDSSTGSRMKWAGRFVTGLPVLFLLMDIAIKFSNHPSVAEASAQLGLSTTLSAPLGVLLATCLTLYLVPRIAPLGAVLLTGYLGGAVLAHLRVDNPVFTHTLFPIYVGALLWTGLFLRDARVRRLFSAK